MADPIVIVGGGLAGAKAAETLRTDGFDGRVVLIAAEPELPYERPPLSKSYLLGKSERSEAAVHPRAFWEEHDVDLVTGVAAVGLDAGARRVELDDGRAVAYEKLLLATGAVARRPPIDGMDLDGVHVLRQLRDADALRSVLVPGASVAIIGAGWIGCEVAAAARTLGADVTLIEQGETPLEAVLGTQLGGVFAELHRSHGVDLLTRARVERIEGDGRVAGVRVGGDRLVDCDAVVVGVGATPDVRLAVAAGLRVDDGVVVDDHLRTSAPEVFAAGDVANAFHPRYGRHVRVEHWANALNQGVAAARSMLGSGEPYARLPYFFSDQYDAGMEYAGLHSPGDRLVVRGDLGSRPLRAVWLDGSDRVTAGMHLDDWGAIDEIKELIETGEPVAQ